MASDENINDKLIRHIDTGNIDQMIDLIENFEFSELVLDKGLRKCLKNMNTTKIDNVFFRMFKNLVKKCNFNYQSKDDNNSTILMVICSKGEVLLLDEILKSNHPNVKLTDSNSHNSLHYAINTLPEETALCFIECLFPKNLHVVIYF